MSFSGITSGASIGTAPTRAAGARDTGAAAAPAATTAPAGQTNAAAATGFDPTTGTDASAQGSSYATAASAAPQAAAAPTAPAGPAVWSEGWATKFADAGAPTQLSQQLALTGGMGMGEAELGAFLEQATGEIKVEREKFAAAYPHEYKSLVEAPREAISPAMITEIAMAVNAGEIDEKTLHMQVEMVEGERSGSFSKMMGGDMLPYSVVPGWGLISGVAGMVVGAKEGDVWEESRNPLSDRKLFPDTKVAGIPLEQVMTPLLMAGGAATLYKLGKAQVAANQGRALAQADPAAAKIATKAGIDATKRSVEDFLPFRTSHKVYAGLARRNELVKGIAAMEQANPGSLQSRLAQDVLRKWDAGDIRVTGDSVMKFGKFPMPGIWSQSRGVIPVFNRGKELAMVDSVKGVRTIALDARMTGPSLAAHMAAAGAQLAEGDLRTEVVADAASKSHNALGDGKWSDAGLKELKQRITAVSAKDLQSSGHLAKPSMLGSLSDKVAPAGRADALKLITKLDDGKIGMPGVAEKAMGGFAGMSKGGKAGVIGGLMAAVGGGTYLGLKALGGGGEEAPAADQAAQGAAAAGAAAPADAEAAAVAAVAADAEFQAGLKEFAALPAADQKAMLESMVSEVEAAQAEPQTPEMSAAITTQAARIDAMIKVVEGGAQAPATGAAPAAAAAPATAPAAAPAGLSRQGMGLE